VLSDDERAQIHERSLRLLATTGMRVDTAHGRRLLHEGGALVDESRRMVRFPCQLVEESLRLAPKHFSLGGRRPGWSFPVNAGQCTLVNSGEATEMHDHLTGELRPGTVQDWRDATCLMDALDEVGVYWAMVQGSAGSAAGNGSAAEIVAYNHELMATFSKHIQDAIFDAAHAPWLLEALQIVYGDRERIRREHPYSFLVTPVSPLIVQGPNTDAWLALRGWDIPVTVLPMPIMGSTAPGTMLATLLQANTEMLGMLCLAQAAEPGVPFISAMLPVTMDPRTGAYMSNRMHPALSAAATEMGRFYGLPVMGNGFGSAAYVPGEQAAIETAFSATVGGLAWPDIMLGPGTLGGATVFSLEQTVIDVEAWRLVAASHEGVPASDQTWLDDVLECVGPGGNFLGERSTRRNAHGGDWFHPGLGWHDSHAAWVAAGCLDVVDEARERVAAILARHEPLPLDGDTARALAALHDRARKA
jgi:trimethylamine---corrinoid protein Co-methyltransferase